MQLVEKDLEGVHRIGFRVIMRQIEKKFKHPTNGFIIENE